MKLPGNLFLTMRSGQPPEFLWHEGGGSFHRTIAGGQTIVLKQENDTITASPRHAELAAGLLRAQDDLEEIYAELGQDEHLARAIARFRGMRLTKSGAWETLLCFLCGQNSNIKRIRANVQSLCGPSGSPLDAEEIASADLRHARLGYREKFIKQTAGVVARGEFDLEGIARLDYETAHEELQELAGVGSKVADCVLLYGFGMLDAFPNDVWIGRAMRGWYDAKTPREVRRLAKRKWGPIAGYAQQYLFMLARSELRKPSHAQGILTAPVNL